MNNYSLGRRYYYAGSVGYAMTDREKLDFEYPEFSFSTGSQNLEINTFTCSSLLKLYAYESVSKLG